MNTEYIVYRYFSFAFLGLALMSLGMINGKWATAADALIPASDAAMTGSKKSVISGNKPKKVKKGEKLAKQKTAVAVTPAEPVSEPSFAVVNGKPIALHEYNAALAEIMRQRFYHGSIPEDKAEAVYKEVADNLIDRELLAEEADRRGIRPDMAQFEKIVAETDALYSKDAGWPAAREKMLPGLKSQMTRQSLVERLQKSVRDMPQPTLTETRTYYEQKPELFTEPAKPRLRIILLKVDPSSSTEDWSQAREKAEGIYKRIKEGADFAEEARLHSMHDSAVNGGDMGYLHGGMLTEGLQAYIDKLQVGERSKPVRMLEGYAIYQLEDLIPAKLQEFSAIQDRAQELLKRSWADQAWKETIGRLRATAKIKLLIQPSPITNGMPPGQ